MGISPDFLLIMQQVNVSKSLELISLFNWHLENTFYLSHYTFIKFMKVYTDLKKIQIYFNGYNVLLYTCYVVCLYNNFVCLFGVIKNPARTQVMLRDCFLLLL